MAGLQAVCFLFVHVIGTAFSIDVEHAHHGDAHHDHDFAGGHVVVSAVADSHHHEHYPFPSHEDHEGEDPISPSDSAPSSHSHLLSFNVAPAIPVSGKIDYAPRYGSAAGFLRFEQEPCPDGPSFEVIKPPQLS